MQGNERRSMDPINTHGLIVGFGKHKGQPWTRVPVSYLKWLVNEKTNHAPIAEAELKRRGTTTPDLDISGHAVDRASQQCLDIWQRETDDGKDDGIHGWLAKKAAEALALNDRDEKGRHRLDGMLFAFEMDGEWPVLKTVMRKGN